MANRAEAEEAFVSWLSSISLLEYCEKFTSTGYNDLKLLSMMDENELNVMMLEVGVQKQGHVLKMKKAIRTIEKQPFPLQLALSNQAESYCLVMESNQSQSGVLKELSNDVKKTQEEVSSLRNDLLKCVQKGKSIIDMIETPRKRRKTAPVECQGAVRSVYKSLLQNHSCKEEDDELHFTGFKLDERFDSIANQEVARRTLKETQLEFGDKDEFTVSTIKCATQRYYNSLKDDFRRKDNGEIDTHRTNCRRQLRLKNKLRNRLAGLKTIDWPKEKKSKVDETLTMEYVSSEDSDVEVDEGDGSANSIIWVKSLPWESKELTDAKQSLDAEYLGRLSRRARFKRFERRKSSQVSSRKQPKKPIQWAVKESKTSTRSAESK